MEEKKFQQVRRKKANNWDSSYASNDYKSPHSLDQESGLKIGEPNDKYEQEADRVAEHVVNSEQKTSNKAASNSPGVQMMSDEEKAAPKLQKAEEEEATPKLQKMEEEEATPKLQKMEEEEATPKLQKMEEEEATPKLQKMEEEEATPKLQKMEEEEATPKLQKMEEEEATPKLQKMEEEEATPKLQKMEEEEATPKLQKMEEEEATPKLQKMEEEEATPKLQKMEEEEATPKLQKMEEEEATPKLQKKEGESGGQATPKFKQELDSTKGGGQQLPDGTRGLMEDKMGANFEDVKVHNDDKSAQLNKDIGAQAFTHGKDVYFNQGKYSPESTDGKKLLAHELTHVVQQNGDEVQKKKENGKSKE